MKKPLVSIVIRTYNEEKRIGRCLNAVFSQKVDFPFEVIIVDSESTDKTLEIAKRFPVRIIKIKKKEFSWGGSINLGCEIAKGRYCASLGADAIPVDECWLAEIIKPFENEKIAGVYGRQIPYNNCNPFEARAIIGTFGESAKMQKKDYFFSNINCALRRELWEKNKLVEHANLVNGEDLLWAKQMLEKDFMIYYQPKSAVYHSHNRNLFSTYDKIRRDVFGERFVNEQGALNIIFKGTSNFFYSILKDSLFLVKTKKFEWAFMIIPHNMAILGGFASAAFAKTK